MGRSGRDTRLAETRNGVRELGQKGSPSSSEKRPSPPGDSDKASHGAGPDLVGTAAFSLPTLIPMQRLTRVMETGSSQRVASGRLSDGQDHGSGGSSGDETDDHREKDARCISPIRPL